MDSSMICSVRPQGNHGRKFKTGPAKRRKPKPTPAGSPIKVVHISNPIRVKATASEFRALVQELTGQDSELPDLARFSGQSPSPLPQEDDDPAPQSAGPVAGLGGGVPPPSAEEEEYDDDPAQEVPAVDPLEICTRFFEEDVPLEEGSDEQDLDFMPQMLENIVELWPSSSSFLYRSS
ncbi:hypothetical protein SAY86_012177 [Trapa natans]|uniref:VQ domain-containing protein n=1 Tax=Trapa natans TaxID=22666 RepID=A0AAN7MC66_TRANT|nr:hypothetical protein SAY86_012177 [Trapa natans]